MPAAIPPAAVLLRRAWRLRCPACGDGPVFARGFRRAPDCTACGRRLDRDEGHWLGGAEVLMAASWGAGVLVLFPIVLLADLADAAVHGLAIVHLAVSVALVRPSRGVFLALDYAIDPTDDGPRRPPGDDEGDPQPAPTPDPVRARGPRPRRRGSRSIPVPA